MIEEFIQNATDRGQSQKPDIMMRDIRQFMSGMKNFLFNRQVPEVDSVMDKVRELCELWLGGRLHVKGQGPISLTFNNSR